MVVAIGATTTTTHTDIRTGTDCDTASPPVRTRRHGHFDALNEIKEFPSIVGVGNAQRAKMLDGEFGQGGYGDNSCRFQGCFEVVQSNALQPSPNQRGIVVVVTWIRNVRKGAVGRRHWGHSYWLLLLVRTYLYTTSPLQRGSRIITNRFCHTTTGK
jgi:hypothetical protein